MGHLGQRLPEGVALFQDEGLCRGDLSGVFPLTASETVAGPSLQPVCVYGFFEPAIVDVNRVSGLIEGEYLAIARQDAPIVGGNRFKGLGRFGPGGQEPIRDQDL